MRLDEINSLVFKELKKTYQKDDINKMYEVVNSHKRSNEYSQLDQFQKDMIVDFLETCQPTES